MIFCMAARVRRRPHIITSTLRARGTVTIPQEIRDRLDLAEGDQLIVTIEDDRIILTPASLIPDDQAWFWTPEWQAREAEADEAVARGEHGKVFASSDEFLAFLDASMTDSQ
jgi:AbrB family looped-hinge helix DNA binding protein